MPGMELNHDEVFDAPRPAATVVLLRDGAQGVETFMLKRHAEADVLAGAYVFPGGKVDREDGEDEALHAVDAGLDPQTLADALAEPGLSGRRALAIHLAAVRETFEECEVLLADAAEPACLEQARLWLRDGMSTIEIALRLRLRLSVNALTPLSRWITPKVPSLTRRRFDTRFFLAKLPTDQQALSSSAESESGRWFAPRDALTAHWQGEIELAPPQLMTLAQLARFASTEQALASARARAPALVEPHPMQRDGARVVAYPGDPDHPVGTRAMPGPTRLIYSNGRFVPLDGYEAWFT